MLPLIQELQSLTEENEANQFMLLSESADKYLGQIYLKLGNKSRSLKQQDIDPTELAKMLSGFRVLGKSDLRSGFADVSKPLVLLRLLNDVAEAGQEKFFGEDPNHKVIADERISQVGETAPSFVEQYEELLKKLEEDGDDEQTRETLLRDINKMRTFFEQIRSKLKMHLSQKHNNHLQNTAPTTA